MAREFLEVIDADEAHRRFGEAVRSEPLEPESVPLAESHGRVLAEDIVSPVDVPGFDRSNVDGYAVRAEDTFGAGDGAPRTLRLNGESLVPGIEPRVEVTPGTATYVATGGMMPRGADTVVMVEYATRRVGEDGDDRVDITRALTPGSLVSCAGSDIARGEVVLRRGTRLTARETGTLAALGLERCSVFRRPRVAVFSTGDEIIAPGDAMRPGLIFDANRTILCDTLREIGCEPVDLGVVSDDREALRQALGQGLAADAVVFSGGTSKGEGDLSVPVIEEVARILAHGVAVKPGKPIALAATDDGKPVVVLPGFPTSAVFTFHEFVVPVLRRLAGAPAEHTGTVQAKLPMRVNSERGREEFLLVGLIEGDQGLAAYPMGKGSGSITAFARADGFITIPRQQELLEADETVEVRLLGRDIRPADLVVIGSHCVGLDLLLSRLVREGYSVKSLAVGSQGALLATARGEADLGGMHLCDASGEYNTPFLEEGQVLVRGYGRMQGIVSRDGKVEPTRDRMVNRNRGSGTRAVIDELLSDARPAGYTFEVRSHQAVGAAVSQGRADWGVAIANVAGLYGLEFRPLREERYDFVLAAHRGDRPAVRAFRRLLEDPTVRAELEESGFGV